MSDEIMKRPPSIRRRSRQFSGKEHSFSSLDLPPQRIGIPKTDSASTFDEADSIDSMQQSMTSLGNPVDNRSFWKGPSRGVLMRDSISTLGDESICSNFCSRPSLKFSNPMMNIISRNNSTNSEQDTKRNECHSPGGNRMGIIAKISRRPSLSFSKAIRSSKELLEDQSKDELPVLPTRLASSHSHSQRTFLSTFSNDRKKIRGEKLDDLDELVGTQSEDESPVLPTRFASANSHSQRTFVSAASNRKKLNKLDDLDELSGSESSPKSRSPKLVTQPSHDAPRRNLRSRSRSRSKSRSRNSRSKSSHRNRGRGEPKVHRERSFGHSSTSLGSQGSGRSRTRETKYSANNELHLDPPRRPVLGPKSSSERILSSGRRSMRSKSPNSRLMNNSRSNSRRRMQSPARPRSHQPPDVATKPRPSLSKKYGSEKGLEAALHESERNLINHAAMMSKRASERSLGGNSKKSASRSTHSGLSSHQHMSERHLDASKRSSSASRPRLTRPYESTSKIADQDLDSSIEALEERLRSTRWYQAEVQPTNDSSHGKTKRQPFRWADQ